MMWPTVELREIRAFLVLAEELHFGRTAERLEITPSRVSQLIRDLEARAGGKLFERTSRRVRLTPAGEQLRTGLRPVDQQLEQAFTVVGQAMRGVAGTLRIGMYSACNGGPHLLEIAKTFESRHPGCRVMFTHTGFGRDQLDWLRDGELDLLAMRLPLSASDVVIGPVLSVEPRVLAVATDHPLAGRDAVEVEDLADYVVTDVPSLPRDLMNAFVPPYTPSGRRLQRADSRAVAETPVRVALGEIVHPSVPSFLQYYPHPGVTAVPIRDLPSSRTALIWLAGDVSAAMLEFVRAAEDVLPTPSSPVPDAAVSDVPRISTSAGRRGMERTSAS